MNTKEHENQLTLKLSFEIGLTVFLWLISMLFIRFGIWKSSQQKNPPLSIMNNVPSINQADIDVLRTSFKPVHTTDLQLVRPEPFN